MTNVKYRRRRGYTRISAKHQVTLPVDAMAAAGVRSGDTLKVEVDGDGRITLVRQRDPLDTHAGRLTGVYGGDELDELRDGWR